MTYDQHNFLVVVNSKTESMTGKMDEVFEVKLSLAQHFLNNDYKFAIVGEDVVSNEMRLGNVLNLVMSVIPQCDGTIKRIDESNKLKTAIANVIGALGYRCVVSDEDMMSDFAKKKIQYLPKEEGRWYEV